MAESVGAILARLNIPEACKTYEVTYINNPLVGAVTYRHYDLRKRPQNTEGGTSRGHDQADRRHNTDLPGSASKALCSIET
jgi:hypothetical protein